jgi:hypothetical protein
MKRLIFVAVLSLQCVSFSAFASINEADAVRAIIGEAANQGKDGMLAVACAIRNRGNLKGVFGLNAKFVDDQPQWVWDHARAAWAESATHDVTDGATSWDNINAFGEPYWARTMHRTVRVGDHQFFKPS